MDPSLRSRGSLFLFIYILSSRFQLIVIFTHLPKMNKEEEEVRGVRWEKKLFPGPVSDVNSACCRSHTPFVRCCDIWNSCLETACSISSCREFDPVR